MSVRHIDPARLLPVADDYWALVAFDPSGCWLWGGRKDWKGYGEFKDWKAHRASVVLSTGRAIPPGMQVLHKCDIRLCVRPDHLYVGTHADNMRDRDERGGTARGDRLPWTKLTPDDVRKIRGDVRHGQVIAAEYGVSEDTVNGIRRRETWKWVEDTPGPCPCDGTDCVCQAADYPPPCPHCGFEDCVC